MMCNYPVRLPDRDFLVPCRMCLACKIARRREWTARITHEAQYWTDNSFVTLTYDNENLPENNSLDKYALTNFFKRLRKRLNGRKIKYFACGEYGDKTNRPHYHALIFGVGTHEIDDLAACWRLGHVHAGFVTVDSASYVAGYIDKKYSGEKNEQIYSATGRIAPFQRQSAGLGLRYAIDNKSNLSCAPYCVVDGKKIGLPRYYVDKLGLDKEEMRIKAQEAKNDEVEKIMDNLDKVPQRIKPYLEMYSREYKAQIITADEFLRDVASLYNHNMTYKRRDKALSDKHSLTVKGSL